MPAATSSPKSNGMVELSESLSKVGFSTTSIDMMAVEDQNHLSFTSRLAAPWGDRGGAGGAIAFSPNKSDISWTVCTPSLK